MVILLWLLVILLNRRNSLPLVIRVILVISPPLPAASLFANTLPNSLLDRRLQEKQKHYKKIIASTGDHKKKQSPPQEITGKNNFLHRRLQEKKILLAPLLPLHAPLLPLLAPLLVPLLTPLLSLAHRLFELAPPHPMLVQPPPSVEEKPRSSASSSVVEILS